MKLIYLALNKSLMRLVAAILLISFGFAEDNLTILDSVSARLHSYGGLMFDTSIEQEQGEEFWVGVISVEIIDQSKFILVAKDQIIKVDTDTIFTFTPSTKQVVVDYYFRDEFSILSLLSGNMEAVQVDKVHKRSNDIVVDFIIPEIETKGKIWIDSGTYYPLKINMEDDLDNRTNIYIEAVLPLSSQSKYKKYNTDNWEVVDLRE